MNCQSLGKLRLLRCNWQVVLRNKVPASAWQGMVHPAGQLRPLWQDPEQARDKVPGLGKVPVRQQAAERVRVPVAEQMPGSVREQVAERV